MYVPEVAQEYDKTEHLLSTNSAPGTVLKALHILIYLILRTAL